jgi:hypothetical protein
LPKPLAVKLPPASPEMFMNPDGGPAGGPSVGVGPTADVHSMVMEVYVDVKGSSGMPNPRLLDVVTAVEVGISVWPEVRVGRMFSLVMAKVAVTLTVGMGS